MKKQSRPNSKPLVQSPNSPALRAEVMQRAQRGHSVWSGARFKNVLRKLEAQQSKGVRRHANNNQ